MALAAMHKIKDGVVDDEDISARISDFESEEEVNFPRVFSWSGKAQEKIDDVDQQGFNNIWTYFYPRRFQDTRLPSIDSNKAPPPFIGGAVFIRSNPTSFKIIKKWGITDYKGYVIIPEFQAMMDGMRMSATLIMYTAQPPLQEGQSEETDLLIEEGDFEVVIGAVCNERDKSSGEVIKTKNSFGVGDIAGGNSSFSIFHECSDGSSNDSYNEVTFFIGKPASPLAPVLVAKYASAHTDPKDEVYLGYLPSPFSGDISQEDRVLADPRASTTCEEQTQAWFENLFNKTNSLFASSTRLSLKEIDEDFEIGKEVYVTSKEDAFIAVTVHDPLLQNKETVAVPASFQNVASRANGLATTSNLVEAVAVVTDAVVAGDNNPCTHPYLKEISWRAGLYIDAIAFHFSDDANSKIKEHRYGGSGGNGKPNIILENGEHLVSVIQYQGNLSYLGGGFNFETSTGRVLELHGGSLGPLGTKYTVSSPAKRIVDLIFTGSRITGIVEDFICAVGGGGAKSHISSSPQVFEVSKERYTIQGVAPNLAWSWTARSKSFELHNTLYRRVNNQTNKEFPPFIGGAVLTRKGDGNFKIIKKWGVTKHKAYVIMTNYDSIMDGKSRPATFVMYTAEPRDGGDVVNKRFAVIVGAVYKSISAEGKAVETRKFGSTNIFLMTGRKKFKLHMKLSGAQAVQKEGAVYSTITFYIDVPKQNDEVLVARGYSLLMSGGVQFLGMSSFHLSKSDVQSVKQHHAITYVVKHLEGGPGEEETKLAIPDKFQSLFDTTSFKFNTVKSLSEIDAEFDEDKDVYVQVKEDHDVTQMNTIQKMKYYYDMERTQEFITLLTVGMAVFSIVNAILALIEFQAATENYDSIIKNFERKPITGLYLTNSSSGCTEDGYTELEMPNWPGTKSRACACPSGAYWYNSYQLSEKSSCSANQTNAGCFNQPALDRVNLEYWRGMKVCYKREGEAQIVKANKMRPIPDRPGVCEKGYQACGGGTYNGARTVCIPENLDCPLTSAAAGETLVEGFNDTNKYPTGDDTNWYFRYEYNGEMPINNLEVVLYSPNGKRGHCFIGGQSQKSYRSKGRSYDYENDYPLKCEKVDSRWETLDYIPESDFLLDHFEDTNACLNDVDIDDYVSTGNVCGSLPFSDTDCMVYNIKSGFITCGSSDTVCNNVYYQSECGAYTRVANKADQNWAIQFQREIYWDSKCEVTMLDLKATQQPLEDIYPALVTNLVFNVFGNFFLGIVFPGMILYNKLYGDLPCVSGKGEKEKKILEFNKKYTNLALSSVKLIVGAIALGLFTSVARTIRRARDGNCVDSDDNLTKRTFVDLDNEIESSVESLWTQVSIDIFNIIVAILAFVLAHMASMLRSVVSGNASDDSDDSDDEKGKEEEGKVKRESKSWEKLKVKSNKVSPMTPFEVSTDQR